MVSSNIKLWGLHVSDKEKVLFLHSLDIETLWGF